MLTISPREEVSIIMTEMIIRLINTVPDIKPEEIAYIFGVTAEEAQRCLNEADKMVSISK